MTDIVTITPVPWIDLISAVREVRRCTALSYEKSQEVVVKIIAEGVVRVRGVVKPNIDIGWLGNGSDYAPWTPEESAKIRFIEADLAHWKNAKIDWPSAKVNFQESAVSDVELDAVQLKSWLRAMLYNEPAIGTKKAGRDEIIDWKPMYFEMIRWANTPDGMPEDMKFVINHMVEWVTMNYESPPDRKTISDRVKEYFAYAAKRRGNPFPAPH